MTHCIIVSGIHVFLSVREEKLKKMDNPRANELLDLINVRHICIFGYCLSLYMTGPRIAQRMQSILDAMNSLYTSMSEKEAEAVTDMDGASLGFPKRMNFRIKARGLVHAECRNLGRPRSSRRTS